jgi:hypothetical protein
MPITLVSLPVGAVLVDDDRYPDRDQSLITDHLVHYLSKVHTLPAIEIAVVGGVPHVVGRHKYLIAARRLGRERIRGVVSPAAEPGEVARFLERSDVEVLDWEQIKALDGAGPAGKSWSVFFFERTLSPSEKGAFDRTVADVFAAVDPDVRVIHDDAGPLAEFEAWTRPDDQAWKQRHLHAFATFDESQVRIVSFQGRRFPSRSGDLSRG